MTLIAVALKMPFFSFFRMLLFSWNLAQFEKEWQAITNKIKKHERTIEEENLKLSGMPTALDDNRHNSVQPATDGMDVDGGMRMCDLQV